MLVGPRATVVGREPILSIIVTGILRLCHEWSTSEVESVVFVAGGRIDR